MLNKNSAKKSKVWITDNSRSETKNKVKSVVKQSIDQNTVLFLEHFYTAISVIYRRLRNVSPLNVQLELV